MEDQLYSFDPGTVTTKAPLPTDFRHLLGWTDKLERFLTIHTHDEMINIDQQLDQTLNLQVSNIISRVIAQIIGLSDLGWRTIKATQEGALKVAIDGVLSDTKNLLYGKIDIATAATHAIIAATAGQKIHVINLIFTVGGDCNITLKTGATAMTGAMDFGGTGEARGIVIPLGVGPLVCASGEAFNITLSAAEQVSGFVTYYKQLA
ncbi:hypothetical protein ES702_05747 [subsurface metagenome]